MHVLARAAIGSCALFVSLAASTQAGAAEPDHVEEAPRAFGAPGRVVLDDVVGASLPATIAPIGVIGFRVGWFTVSHGSLGGDASTILALAPSVDVFVTEHLTVGGIVSASWSRQEHAASPSTSSYGAGLAPRVGWAAPIGEGIAVWPRVHGGAALAGGDVASDPSWSVGADTLFVLTLTRHAVLDVGPSVTYGVQPTIAGTMRSLSAGVSGGLSLVF